MTARALAVSVILAFAAITAGADTLLVGDLVTGIQYNAVLCPTPPSVLVFSSQLQTKYGLYAGGLVTIDAIGHVYALENDLPPSDPNVVATTIDVFDTSFRKIRSIAIPEPARGLAVDSIGTAYVVSGSGTVRVYSPAGNLVRAFTLPDPAAAPAPLSLDISSDRCTLVYLGSGGVAHRFDSCTDSVLAPAIGPRFDSVRALADGGLIGSANGRLLVYDRSGHLAADRAAPTKDPVTALSFGVSGDSLWVGSHSNIYQVRLTDGAIVAHIPLSYENPRSVAVFGETRPTAAAESPSKRHASRH